MSKKSRGLPKSAECRRCKKLRREIEEMNSKINKLTGENAQSEQKYAALLNDSRSFVKQYEETTKMIDEQRSQISRLKGDLAIARNIIKVYEEAHNKPTGE
ncbi:MAG: hypothetical protein HY762_05495 [Planctomycetes bacterium]|nr:hypothetical protein [Planctomycetota bacterium]